MTEEKKNENRARIGQLIALKRKERGMTQKQLSDLSGVSVQNITKVENGRYNVSVDILGKMCEAMGCRIEIAEEEH